MNKKEYNKEWLRKRRYDNKSFALKFLGEKCSNCEAKQNLQFDHINPSEKIASITSMLLKSRINLVKELKKCQLLCYGCHLEKTKKDRVSGRPRKSLAHGCITSYQHDGCRCDKCVEFNKQYRKQYYKRNPWYTTDKKRPNHGTSYYYYRYKCRCNECVTAYSKAKEKASALMKSKRELEKSKK